MVQTWVGILYVFAALKELNILIVQSSLMRFLAFGSDDLIYNGVHSKMMRFLASLGMTALLG